MSRHAIAEIAEQLHLAALRAALASVVLVNEEAASHVVTPPLLAAVAALAMLRMRYSPKARMSERAIFIGIDIGASAIKLGLFSLNEERRLVCIAQEVDPCAPGSMTSTQLVQRMREIASDLVSTVPLACWRDVKGVGMAIPGRVEDGCVLNPANFPRFGPKVDLARETCECFEVATVRVCNDANAALLGEMHFRVAADDCVLITLGSGVGAAVLSNGRLMTGSTGMFGEIGHTIVHFDANARVNKFTGVRGIVEEYASARAVQTTWTEMYPALPYPGLAAVFAKQSAETCAVADFTIEHIAALVVNAARL